MVSLSTLSRKSISIAALQPRVHAGEIGLVDHHDSIALAAGSVQELRQQRSVAELMPDLKRMMDHNEELEQLPLFGMMVSYAQTEEYALGDEIYQKEEMGIEELVEKNYTLYQGYERAVSLLTEDIEMYA